MADAPNRQKEVFLKAIELPAPAERAAFVATACGSDLALREQVEAMLQAHLSADSFLEKPAAALGATIDAESGTAAGQTLASTKVGSRIGPYKLLEQIGDGGMGIVFMAEQQEPVRRRVALKIIKPGMDSSLVLARFEAERQALALMEHPNIARVLDAGTTPEGRPFFVMELVKGVPITQYCDERRLTPRQRLALFIPVCQAVQHAHQKGIIHRDLKPSNVLIAQYDGKPVPKVIDFGVAKATSQQLTERTLFTGFGAVVGTLAYMSPEQAELNQIDIDTRSDIYSLGVVLYELLTGNTPIERQRLKEGALLEALRLIREEEPPRPSTRLSTANTLATLSAQRQTEPAKLAGIVRGDIDWIVMKALDKDRDRRYATAAVMGQDIQRYLNDEPVEASPPSAAYRLRKFIKRNRGSVMAASILFMVLLGGVVGTSLAMLRARQAEQEMLEWYNHAVEKTAEAVVQEGKARLAEEAARHSEKQEKAAREHAENNERTALAQTERAEKSEAEVKKRLKEARQTLFATQIERAAILWQHDPVQGQKVLRNSATCPYEDRDFTWHLFQRLCDVERTVFHGVNGAMLTSAALSPDGKYLAAGCQDNTVLLWEYPSGRFIRLHKGHKDAVISVAFGSDSKTLFSGSEDRTILRWDVANGQPHGPPWTMPGTVSGLAMQPGGKWLAAGSHVENKNDNSGWRLSQGTVTLWHVDTGERKEITKAMPDGVITTAFSPDGKWIAAGFGIDVCARVWDVETGKEYGKFQGANEGWVQGLTFSPDGKHLALATADLRLHVFDFATKAVARVYEGHQNELWGVAISPKSKVIATTGWDRTLRLWNLHDRWDDSAPREQMVFPGYLEKPVLFTPDGQGVIVQKQGNLVLVAPPTHAEEHTLTYHGNGIVALAFSADGRHLASTGSDHRIMLWSGTPGSQRVLGSTAEPSRCVEFSPDSQLVFAGTTEDMPDKSRRHQVDRWNVKTGQRLEPLLGHLGPITSLAVSPKHGLLASASMDGGANGVVRVWNLADGKLVEEKKLRVTSLAFHPVDKKLVFTHANKLTAWNLADGTMKTQSASPAANRLCYSATGKHLFLAHHDAIQLYDVDQPNGGAEFIHNYGRQILAFAVTPDEKTLALGLKDRTIQLWDIPSRQLRATLSGHARSVTALAFSPDGKSLASGDRFLEQGFPWVRQGVIKLWSAQPRRTLGHDSPPDRLAFTNGGGRLSSISGDSQIIWDAQRGTALTVLPRVLNGFNGGHLTDDGRHVVAWEVGAKSVVVVRDAASGTVLLRHDSALAEIPTFVTGPNRTVGWFAEGVYHALDLQALRPLPSVKVPQQFTAPLLNPIWAPNGRWLAVQDQKAIHVWHVHEQRETSWANQPPSVPATLVALDNERVLGISSDGAVRVWQVDTGRLLATLPDFGNPAFAVSPDGRTLAMLAPAGGSRMTPAPPQGPAPKKVAVKAPRFEFEVRFFDLTTGKETLAPVPIGALNIVALALSADDQLHVAVDEGTVVKFLPKVKIR